MTPTIERTKREGELAYWRERHDQEGQLRNRWYEPAYTARFGLTHDDYAGKRVLDVGCGPRGSLEWASMAAQRIGLDPLADDYLELGVAEHEMTYVASGAEAMPFPAGSFDIVCAFNSLDHVDDPDAVIAEIVRVTAVGGLLLLMVDIHRRPTPQEPVLLPWDVDQRFRPDFQPQLLWHLEKGTRGTYASLAEEMPFDHSDPTDRYGILAARMVRVDPATWWPGGPLPTEVPAAQPAQEPRASRRRWWRSLGSGRRRPQR